MAKLTLSDLANLSDEQSAIATINANSALIETAVENTLSRDGTSPNSMSNDLDMNSNQIMNLPSPNYATSPLRLQDLSDFIGNGTITIANFPSTASYLTLGTNATLTAERVLTAGTNIAFTDGGANSTLTVATSASPTFATSVTTPIVSSSTSVTSPLLVGSTSVTTPLVIGGSGAASTLTLESTSGTGTTDKINFKTGAQVTTAYFETVPSTNTYTPASGSVIGQFVMDVGNAKNVRSVTGEFDIPGIGPLPPAGQMYIMSRYADSATGNISNIYSVAWNSGTRLTAAVTGIAVAPTGSSGTNHFGGQFSAVALGSAGGVLQGLNIESDWSTGTITGIGATIKLGDSAGGTTANPGNAYIYTLADQGKAPLYGWRLDCNTLTAIDSTGSVIKNEGNNLSCAYGINFTDTATFATAAFKSLGFIVGPTGSFGYTTGAGGTVTQASSKSTTVVLNKQSGSITMNNAALAGGAIVAFALTNSTIASTDSLVLNHNGGGTLGSYTLNGACGTGTATIYVRNNTGGSLSEALVLSFALIKGATS